MKTVSFAQATREALEEALVQDDSVFLLGEDIADREGGNVFKICAGLSERFGVERVRSTPISEQAIVGAGIGAAIAGMRPVIEIMLMNFLAVAMDQIVNHAAKIRYMSGGQTSVPLTIRTVTGVGRGTGGQHADMYDAWFAHVPGLKVVVPSTPEDQRGLLLSCILDDDPCLFIENMVTYFQTAPVPDQVKPLPLGKAKVSRVGRDITVIGYGHPLMAAMKVAERLADAGIDIEVVDLRTISPLDMQTVLESVAKTKRAIVIHEGVKAFGVGAEISASISEELHGEMEAPVIRLGAQFSPVPFSKPLETDYFVGEEKIEEAVVRLLEHAK